MSDFAPVAMRPKTFLEKQPYMAAYCVAISIPSPVTIIYQLGKLNRLSLPPSTMFKLSMQILPHQTLLKLAQMNISTPVKEYLNPWAAFAVVGVIQGGVYGQANVHFAKALQIGKNPELKGMFRGVLFAGGRDVISQGIPFMCSKYVKKYLFDPIVPSNMEAVSLWGSILSTSIVSTYLSQGFQNCQITFSGESSCKGPRRYHLALAEIMQAVA